MEATNSFKKEEHENAQWGRVFIDVGCLFYSNPLGAPVNLWTTGTVGRQFVLSVHCVTHSEQVCLHFLMNVHQSLFLVSVL